MMGMVVGGVVVVWLWRCALACKCGVEVAQAF